MKLQNTTWKPIIVKDKKENNYELGYETEGQASEEQLRELQKLGILVQVVPSKGPQFIQPDNADKRHFAAGQKFRVTEKNKSFDRFEEALWGEYPPEDRFDRLVNWTNPNVWRKTDKGYFLRLSGLSDKKQEELRDNLRDLGTPQNGGISVSGKGNVETLEFTWKMAENQLKTRLNRASEQPASRLQSRSR